jgi:hypothetical protein
MTAPRSEPGAQDPMRAWAEMWESSFQSMAEGMRQTQEFWSTMARNWSDMAGAAMGQAQAPGVAGIETVRELQEAAFAVAQAWLRLPLVFMGAAQPTELQEAANRLMQAQNRAYQLWMEALTGAGRAGAAQGETRPG